MMENNNQLPIGAVLDSGVRKYHIVAVLGQGGFGITYKATGRVKIGNIEMTVPFAIKEHFIQDYNERQGTTVTTPNSSNVTKVNDSIDAFLTEAQRLNRLSLEHPGIVKVNENFRANGTAYYVMEYIEGESLRHYVEHHAGGRLSEEEALDIVKKVGQSVQYLHDHQVTHLDIKPDNILLRTDGQPVLIDFGLSKHYDRKGRATSTLKVAGSSDGYSPLEQYAGLKNFSPRADVYALAATLLFMLTGKDPKEASDIRPADIKASLEPAASAATVNAVIHAMSMLKENRTGSVTNFLKELEEGGEHDKEQTESPGKQTERINPVPDPKPDPSPKPFLKRIGAAVTPGLLKWIGAAIGIFGLLFLLFLWGHSLSSNNDGESVDTEKSQLVGNTSQDIYQDSEDSDVETFTVDDVSFRMVRVKSGTFTMGATPEQGSDADSDEKPAHQVTLSTYYIGETEVTQALWETVMGSNPSKFRGDSRPVEMVSWEDICGEDGTGTDPDCFLYKLNKATGRSFRLPTEAEWEFAARGGDKSKGYKYSGGNDVGSLAWYYGNSGSETHPVKTKQPNELGLYDMSGNVWEWCSDWYGSYSSEAQINPTGPSSGSIRVYRGGSWSDDARDCRVSNRYGDTPGSRNISLGLRLAL